jgi:TPP-dependent indolepyruvate ferredoxin oxidoreductase alpha subunit
METGTIERSSGAFDLDPQKLRHPILLMGNHTIARGALEAGVKVVAGYPGTTSSEILTCLSGEADRHGLHVEWSTNEKVASRTVEVNLKAFDMGFKAGCEGP